MIIGLTGGTGSGKSTVGYVLTKLGADVIDADRIAHKLTEPGEPALDEIIAEFGAGIAPEGKLLRRDLGHIVFSDEKKLNILNKIMHKHILQEVIRLAEQSVFRYVVIDAAILLESGLRSICDLILVVTAPEKLRIKRIMERDGLSAKAAIERIRAQKSDECYRKAADYVIENNYDADALWHSVQEFFTWLEGFN